MTGTRSRSGRAFAVVPAAGRSRRMGQAKLLLPWPPGHDRAPARSMIEATLAAWRAAGVDRVVVVTHPEDETLAAVCRGAGADVVVADPPPEDMKASIAWGLDFLLRTVQPTDDDAWLMAPADVPQLSPAAIVALIAATARHPDRILIAGDGERRGHPVLFPWRLARAVPLLPPTAGVNQMFNEHPTELIQVGPSALAPDIDTPDDYQSHQP